MWEFYVMYEFASVLRGMSADNGRLFQFEPP